MTSKGAADRGGTDLELQHRNGIRRILQIRYGE